MDKKLWAKIQKANEDSIKHPGKSSADLPKSESKKDPEIYVFRHGQTTDNINRVFSGWRDAKLTETGIKQAEELAEALKDKHIDLCITSPQSRAKDTAKIALKYHKDILFEEDPRVMERNYGVLQGKSKEKLMRESPELTTQYRRGYDTPPPKGESIKMVEDRVFPFCDAVVERVKKNNINIAISCHGNSMRAIRRYFENLSVAEELTVENPLAQTYAQYVIKNKLRRKSGFRFSKSYLRKLIIPNKKFFDDD